MSNSKPDAQQTSFGAGFKRLGESPAFQPNEQPPSLEPETLVKDRRALRIKCAVLAAVVLVAMLLSCCVSVTTYEVYSLGQVFETFGVWFKVTFSVLFQGAAYTTVDLMEMCPQYYQVLNRLGITFMALLCGIVLAMSGMIYQGVFANPIAAPTMLGVSGGLNMGLLVFVGIYGTSATYATLPHYLFAYGGAVAALVVVLAISKLISGPDGFSVVDMLLVGSIISQVLSQIVLYVSYYVFDDSTWLTYTKINEVLSVDTDPIAYAFLIVAFVVSFVPIYLVRFQLNALSFSKAEARGMGINLNTMRYASLALATIMVIAAMAHSGMVGMAALIVPFISRAFFGAEYRKQVLGNILIGGGLIVICRTIAALLSIVLHYMGFTFNFPIGIVVSLLCMPIFVWIIAIQQRTWD